MTGSTLSSHGLDERRRRLLYHAWHRGIQEADLIMGRFADAYLAELSDAELDQFEQLMEAQEHDLLGWVTNQIAVPPQEDTPLFRRLRDFNLRNGEK